MVMAGWLGPELESPQQSDWEIYIVQETEIRSVRLAVTMSLNRHVNSVYTQV